MKLFKLSLFSLGLLVCNHVFAGVVVINPSCDSPVITINYTEPSPIDNDLAYCTAHIDVNGGTVFNKQINANTSSGGEVRSENHSVGGLTQANNNINVSMSCTDLATPPNTDGPTATQTVAIACDKTGPGVPIF